MAIKSSKRKRRVEGLPTGIKVSSVAASSAARKMVREDRGIASGGRNVVLRQGSGAGR